jgi:adenylate kinase
MAQMFGVVPSYILPSGLSSLQTEPVEGFYKARQKLLEFNIPGGIPESWRKLLEALNIEDSNNMRSAVA